MCFLYMCTDASIPMSEMCSPLVFPLRMGSLDWGVPVISVIGECDSHNPNNHYDGQSWLSTWWDLDSSRRYLWVYLWGRFQIKLWRKKTHTESELYHPWTGALDWIKKDMGRHEHQIHLCFLTTGTTWLAAATVAVLATMTSCLDELCPQTVNPNKFLFVVLTKDVNSWSYLKQEPLRFVQKWSVLISLRTVFLEQRAYSVISRFKHGLEKEWRNFSYRIFNKSFC